MSIYSTFLVFDKHEDEGAPYKYEGSHVFPGKPGDDDADFQIAGIPSHITANGKDDGPEEGWLPWLRVNVNSSTLLLTAEQGKVLRDQLTMWLERIVQ